MHPKKKKTNVRQKKTERAMDNISTMDNNILLLTSLLQFSEKLRNLTD